jgi:antitoxin (DNA-binding transcriptional repressor) of toxin-antitoxin stability system
MRVAPIQPGDMIEVDKRGRPVFGIVVAVQEDGGVSFQPVTRSSYRHASPREIRRHWRRAERARRRDDGEHPGQMLIGGIE